MNESKPVHEIAPAEILASWEGPAIHEPGVLFEEKTANHAPTETDTAELAAWIAVTALSVPVGHPARQAIEAKVVGVLITWRQLYGQPKIAEIRQELVRHLQNYRNQRKITDEELNKRVEALFDQIPPVE
jgi:hypothetical protein